ncbi:MAG: alpha/beta fold hydrolase BchO [Betaproteobacteria bacterium]
MPEGLRWDLEGRDWPNRAASRFVHAGGLRWHVQVAGTGPGILLVHGTGAASHSWRAVLPLLERRFTVVVPDLPGHGFTEAPPAARLSMPGMADALHALLQTLRISPVVAVGNSAGAAIAARMSLDGQLALAGLVSVNGALLPLRGLPGHLFSPMARLLAASSLVPRLFAWRAADRVVVERLVRGTGSTLDAVGIELYGRLIRNPAHAAATLDMMAHWDLRPLERDLPRLQPKLMLVVGTNDLTVPPAEARRVQQLLPAATLVPLAGAGHLAHEERPREVADLIADLADTAEVPTTSA